MCLSPPRMILGRSKKTRILRSGWPCAADSPNSTDVSDATNDANSAQCTRHTMLWKRAIHGTLPTKWGARHTCWNCSVRIGSYISLYQIYSSCRLLIAVSGAFQGQLHAERNCLELFGVFWLVAKMTSSSRGLLIEVAGVFHRRAVQFRFG